MVNIINNINKIDSPHNCKLNGKMKKVNYSYCVAAKTCAISGTRYSETERCCHLADVDIPTLNMVISRVSALYVAIAFILGVLFTSGFIGSQVYYSYDCAKTQSSADDRLRLLREIYELDDVTVHRTATEGEGKSLEKPFESERKVKDVIGQSATNASVKSTKNKLTGLHLLQQGTVY